MSHEYCSYSFLVNTLLLVAVVSIAHGRYEISSTKITRRTFHGRLVCSATGNHVSGVDSLGLVGVNVALTCVSGENRIILAEALTNITGIFEVFLDNNNVKGVARIFESYSCYASVRLPIASCDLLPSLGNLQAPLNLVKVVRSIGGVTAVHEIGFFESCFDFYAIDVAN